MKKAIKFIGLAAIGSMLAIACDKGNYVATETVTVSKCGLSATCTGVGKGLDKKTASDRASREAKAMALKQVNKLIAAEQPSFRLDVQKSSCVYIPLD